jgi:membrane-bound ClpP family serine protease
MGARLLVTSLGALSFLCAALGQAAPKAPPAAQKKQIGWLFRLELPIAPGTHLRLRGRIQKAIEMADRENARPVLIFEFTYPKEGGDFAQSTDIGNAFDLASFLSSERVSRARTVAYLPQSVQGHAVLAVLACDEIVMAPDAELGPASIDPSPSDKPAIVANYRAIVTRRKKFLEDVAVKLADPAQELLQVKTAKEDTQYVTRENLENLKKTKTERIMKWDVLFAANQPARFSEKNARDMGLIQHRAAKDRTELARRLDLELSEPIREEIQVVGSYRAYRVDVKGPIQEGTAGQIKRMIRQAVDDNEANFICVWIESAGGNPAESMEVAKVLALDPKLKDVLTAAYIPSEARGDAALIALACDEIAMHPRAVLGGEGEYVSPEQTRDIVIALREILQRKGRSWSVPAAMFDPTLAVYRFTRENELTREIETAYFCDAEQADAKSWKQWEAIAMPEPGKSLAFVGSDAASYLPGIRLVAGRAEFQQHYSLTKDPALLEPTWVDVLVQALAHPAVGVFLLIVGGAALYAELHSPGIGVGAFVATVCFALFFWAHFLGGTAGWLEVVLFVAGISCLLLEVFVLPGFGIFGLGGGAMILFSLVLASQTFVIPRNAYQAAEFRNSLLAIAAAMVGMIAAASTINRWLPHTPFLGQMVLHPPSGAEAEAIRYSEALAHFEALVGMQGKTTTPLMPGGKARFGKDLVDVVTGGEFVDRDAMVEVVDAQGSRVVVRAVEDRA